MKKILQPILLIIVALGFGAFVWGKISPTTEPAPESATAGTSASTTANAVTVTYFTSDVRCVSCRAIESLTRETLELDFAEAMEGGQLRFQTINIDRAENKHYINEYDLSFKTVVVAGSSQSADGDWEKLDEVWRLLNAPDDFAAYVTAAVAQKMDKET